MEYLSTEFPHIDLECIDEDKNVIVGCFNGIRASEETISMTNFKRMLNEKHPELIHLQPHYLEWDFLNMQRELVYYYEPVPKFKYVVIKSRGYFQIWNYDLDSDIVEIEAVLRELIQIWNHVKLNLTINE